MKKTNKPKILFYDIETTPLQAWLWRPGKQVVNSSQLVEGMDTYDVICICYEWLDSNDRGKLAWNYRTQDSKKMVTDFTAICDTADIIIGKNNKRFDDKHMNTLRLKHGLAGRPDLLLKVDDLETQMRRHFYLPSYKLDYFSQVLGFGGKDKMFFQDWIDIMDQTENGDKAFKKMIRYCSKDVHDTKLIWKHCERHIQPKLNRSALLCKLVCKVCGSRRLRKNGYYTSAAGVRYTQYFCNDHNGYAGKISVNAKKPIMRT